MLKMIEVNVEGNIVSGYLLVEGDPQKKFFLSIDTQPEFCKVIKSDIPDEYSTYERQARVALMRYRDENREIPSEFVSRWY